MPHNACSPPLDGPEKTTDYLAHYCFEPPKELRLRLWVAVAVLIVLAVLALAVWNVQTSAMLLSALSSVATMGLLLAGLWQWRGARQEISMDNYYERLNISNQWWKSSPSVRNAMAGFATDSEDPDMTMYVCLEIDNLEYVVEKYRIGYVDDEQACRGLKAFQVRCLSSAEFRAIARRRVHLGDYTSRARNVVCKVCDEVDNLIEHRRVSDLASGSHPDRPAAAAIQVAPGYPPPPPAGESMGQPTSSVVRFNRRSSDTGAAGGEGASATALSRMQVAPQPGKDTESPGPAVEGGGAESGSAAAANAC